MYRFIYRRTLWFYLTFEPQIVTPNQSFLSSIDGINWRKLTGNFVFHVSFSVKGRHFLAVNIRMTGFLFLYFCTGKSTFLRKPFSIFFLFKSRLLQTGERMRHLRCRRRGWVMKITSSFAYCLFATFYPFLSIEKIRFLSSSDIYVWLQAQFTINLRPWPNILSSPLQGRRGTVRYVLRQQSDFQGSIQIVWICWTMTTFREMT